MTTSGLDVEEDRDWEVLLAIDLRIREDKKGYVNLERNQSGAKQKKLKFGALMPLLNILKFEGR